MTLLKEDTNIQIYSNILNVYQDFQVNKNEIWSIKGSCDIWIWAQFFVWFSTVSIA